ncbi:MAG: response regulator [Bdellovibrionales bacterium]
MREPKDIKILIVDDEADLRKAIVFDFKKRGFVVKEAENGKVAFEIIKNENIDLVLTDVRMPDGDGVELLENIKARNSDLPVVIFITGFADITLEEAYDKGVDAVFAKPFDRKALLNAVIRALSEKDAQWKARQTERPDSSFTVELGVYPSDTLSQGQVLNIGRGGLFVAVPNPELMAGCTVKFSLQYDKESMRLQGTGVIKWVRRQAINNLPAGYGIQFDTLDDESRKRTIEVINSLKTKSFIPKS